MDEPPRYEEAVKEPMCDAKISPPNYTDIQAADNIRTTLPPLSACGYIRREGPPVPIPRDAKFRPSVNHLQDKFVKPLGGNTDYCIFEPKPKPKKSGNKGSGGHSFFQTFGRLR